METHAAERVWWKQLWVWGVVTALLAPFVICGGMLAVFLHADLKLHTQIRIKQIGQALHLYADRHADEMPTGPHWRQALVDSEYLADIYTQSPRAKRYQSESYCYVPGWTWERLREQRMNGDELILVFENPASTDADELLIVTWNQSTRRLPREEVLARLAKTRTGDGKPVTWEGMK
jgi:hypothetical protein